jgi:hypothetical protein
MSDTNAQIEGALLLLTVLAQKLGGTVKISVDDLLDAKRFQVYTVQDPEGQHGATLLTVLERKTES